MKKRSVLAGACNTLLLLLALAAVAEGFSSAYGLEVVPEWLWAGVALAGVGFGILWALPKYKRYLVPGFLGAWGLCVWKFWDVLAWGEVSVRCHVVNTIAAKVPGMTWLQPVEPPPGVPEMAGELIPFEKLIAMARELREIQCVTGWMLAVGAAYALLLGWIVAGGRFIPGFLMTLAPILPAVCVTEAPSPLGVGLLLTVWGTMALRSLSCRTAGAGGAAMTPHALAAAALAVAVVMHLLPVEGRTQTGWAEQLREDVIQGAYRLDLSRWGSFFGRTGSGSTEYVSLAGNGPGYTGRTALRVHTNSPGKHYLRGWSSDVYTGRSWEPLGREAKEELRTILEQEEGEEPLLELGETVAYWSDLAHQPWSSIYIPVGAGEEESFFMEVENVSAPGGALYYPYALAGYPEGVEAGLDSHLEGERGVYKYSFDFYPDYVLWTDLLSTGTGEGTYRDFVYEHETQVPEETRELLLSWLEETSVEIGLYMMGVRSPEDYARLLTLMISGDGDDGAYVKMGTEYYRYKGVEYDISHGLPRELLDSVEVTPEEVDAYRLNYVSMMIAVVDEVLTRQEGEFVYDASTPAPPAGEDYVAHFLGTKRGYCMHFATTAALLLRSLGIPARYASGYVVDVPQTGYAVVPDRAAHAWVEVWIDGVGWYPLDFTPGFEGEGTGPTEEEEFVESTATPEPTPSPSPSPTPSPTPSAEPSAKPSEKPGQEPGGPSGGEKTGFEPVIFGSLLGLMGVGLVLYALKKRRFRKLHGPDTNAAVLYAWKLHRRLERFGCPPDERLEELGKKAKFSQHTLTGDEREEVLGILEADRRRTFRRKRGGES